MDHFGIGAAVAGVTATYFICARRTGRTTALLDSLKDGDRVVCRTLVECKLMQRHCRERKLNVDCIVMATDAPQDVLRSGTSKGRTIFDHMWLEEYYSKGVLELQRAVDFAQREASGYGAAHLEAKKQAIEAAKWVPFTRWTELP